MQLGKFVFKLSQGSRVAYDSLVFRFQAGLMVLVITGFSLSLLSPLVLSSWPAAGGDTGSHYWPLVTLVKEALPNFAVKSWNPGNLGGEPHLVHYFPLPYLVMAVISLFTTLGAAFNIGTILPLVLFPACVFFALRRAQIAPLTAALASASVLTFLYNESYSAWGGNSLSLLAGQFSHLYAFAFFIFVIGELARGCERDEFPFFLCFSSTAVILSHFYVALLLPFVFLFFLKKLAFKFHFYKSKYDFI
jgi:uncharacterized membrane protein